MLYCNARMMIKNTLLNVHNLIWGLLYQPLAFIAKNHACSRNTNWYFFLKDWYIITFFSPRKINLRGSILHKLHSHMLLYEILFRSNLGPDSRCCHKSKLRRWNRYANAWEQSDFIAPLAARDLFQKLSNVKEFRTTWIIMLCMYNVYIYTTLPKIEFE